MGDVDVEGIECEFGCCEIIDFFGVMMFFCIDIVLEYDLLDFVCFDCVYYGIGGVGVVGEWVVGYDGGIYLV